MLQPKIYFLAYMHYFIPVRDKGKNHSGCHSYCIRHDESIKVTLRQKKGEGEGSEQEEAWEEKMGVRGGRRRGIEGGRRTEKREGRDKEEGGEAEEGGENDTSNLV